MSDSLHAEIEALHRSISSIALREAGRIKGTSAKSGAGDEARPPGLEPEIEAAASKGLERLLSRPLPVELRRRLEKIQKKLSPIVISNH